MGRAKAAVGACLWDWRRSCAPDSLCFRRAKVVDFPGGLLPGTYGDEILRS
jgi:hypothetical protein